jgi:predicted transcriptional regulator
MHQEIEEIREISSSLFGRRYQLEVSAAIAQEQGAFFTKGLARQIGLDNNLVHQEVQRLLELGLLKRLPKVEGVQAKYLEPVPSVYWEFTADFVREIWERQSSNSAADA